MEPSSNHPHFGTILIGTILIDVSFGEVVLESGPIEEPEEKILKTNSGTRFIYIAFESINPSRPLDDHGWCIEKKAVIEI